jgi:hypothetical protein
MSNDTSSDHSDKDHPPRTPAAIHVSVLVTAVATPIGKSVRADSHADAASAEPVNAVAGVDRVVMKHGRTYLNGWAGSGTPPRPGRGGRGAAAPAPTGPAPRTTWSKVSGPGLVTFADASAPSTTATFSAAGEYVLRVSAIR